MKKKLTPNNGKFNCSGEEINREKIEVIIKRNLFNFTFIKLEITLKMVESNVYPTKNNL